MKSRTPEETQKLWRDFRSADLLWWVNRSLHLFGWAICVEEDEAGNVTAAYPSRVIFRGFTRECEEEGFKNLTGYMAENASKLEKDVTR